MTYTEALAAIASGSAVTRPALLGAAVYQVTSLAANGLPVPCAPFLSARSHAPGIVPWAPSQADLAATDWAVVATAAG